ncbi:hypothetical protein HDU98_006645 [Podochytrium sp. JEL0797]|nr:hypothetical protein HDU98_006645 [Podochytrium sp. JEL0797]
MNHQAAVEIPDAEYLRLEQILLDQIVPAVPLKARFRALFTLKSVKSDRAVEIIGKAFTDPSVLLKHELCYVLGQMKNLTALPILNKALAAMHEDPMVRHEAAEAMGAIGSELSLPVLEPYLKDECVPVRETVELAVARIHYEMELRAEGKQDPDSGFASTDPAPPMITIKKEGSTIKDMTTKEVGDIMMDPAQTLFIRYKAMFALRNRGTVEAVLELAKGFNAESALFRHEIAYVFGQLQHPAAVPALVEVLNKMEEAPMVRHEAAEALGSIATPECMRALEMYKDDDVQVVKESCIVGLDMAEFENSGDFQYAETVNTVTAMKGEYRAAQE